RPILAPATELAARCRLIEFHPDPPPSESAMATENQTQIPKIATAPPPRKPATAPQPQPQAKSLTPLDWAALAVVILAFVPLGIEHAGRLWEKPHYQFFPFVIAGSALLAWSRWPQNPFQWPGDTTLALIGLWSGLALLLVAE